MSCLELTGVEVTSSANLSPPNSARSNPASPGKANANCTLSVSHLNYTVSERVGPWWEVQSYFKKWTRHILKDVSFYVESGQLMGILGNSGSGKTTLLDAIAGRLRGPANLIGDVYVNGCKLKKEDFHNYFSYVLQSDNLLSYLTVEETLTYIALLTLCGDTNAIKEKVKSVMLELSLNHVANQVIGGRVFRGISGGERRRVSIAAQLLQDPMDLTSVDTRSKEREIETYSRVQEISTSYQNSRIFNDALQLIDAAKKTKQLTSIRFKNTASPSILFKLWILIRRIVRNLSRNKTGILMRLSQNLLYGLFIVFFLMRLNNDASTGAVQDRIGIIYQSIGASPYTGMLNAVALYPSLRSISDQESSDGIYQRWLMLMAYIIHILPFSIISVAIYSTFVYWTLGMFPVWERFGCFLAVLIVPHLVGELLTLILLGVVQNPYIVNSAVALINVAGILVGSGFLRSAEEMPELFRWLSYLTFQKYGVEVLMVNEFYGLNFTCGNGAQTSPNTTSASCWLTQGVQYLDVTYPGAPSRFVFDFLMLYAFLPALVIFGIISFKIRDWIQW
ncbi:ATP-binding cassette sub-family G member 5 isoform X3 [Hypanus sabinus]|uniref:ATP-binding cassette sub-family G member 5 isoform X3 n=1 Tax=Hypanus sabinus TaxID=79690 RepID=UPI0028C3CD5F|nr:ATP-binding cassette sub-family G member 5 isoform X3 [Hypanus sabinus]